MQENRVRVSNRPKLISSGLLCLCSTWLAPALAHAEEGAAKPAGSSAAPPSTTASPNASAASSTPPPIDSNVSPAPGSDHASAGAEGPSAATVTEAKQRFDRGLELYSEGEYSLALIEFNRAYELVPNYRVLYNIGQVGIQLAQYANARRALEAYLEKGGDNVAQDRREAVLRDLDMLKQRTAHLLVTSNVAGAEILIDDVSVGKTPVAAPLLVDAGVHRVVAKHDGYVSHTDRVILAGGDEQTLAVTLNPQPEESQTIVVRERAPEEESHTLMIAGWVTTGALAAGAIVTGVMGANDAKQLDQLRSADPKDNPNLSSKLDSTKSSAKSLLLASDVLSGTALIVGGLSLWVTLSPSHPAQAPDADHPTPQASNNGGRPLQIGYQYGQVKLRGSF